MPFSEEGVLVAGFFGECGDGFAGGFYGESSVVCDGAPEVFSVWVASCHLAVA